MTVDPSVVPGLLFLLAELVALAGVGYVIVLVALRETDRRVALAQGLVVGLAIWGVVVNLVMYVLPGMAGAIAGWIAVLALAAVLMWRSSKSVRPRLRLTAVFALALLAALFWIALASRQTLGIDDAPLRLGLPVAIQVGQFPPELPWNPGSPAPYHFGVYSLNGLLVPPFGPDVAFGEELLATYAWTTLFLVVVTALRSRAAFAYRRRVNSRFQRTGRHRAGAHPYRHTLRRNPRLTHRDLPASRRLKQRPGEKGAAERC